MRFRFVTYGVVACTVLLLISGPRTNGAGLGEHPVLEALGLSASELPSGLHLVRSPRPLPPDLDITVHAREGARRLVSADSRALSELTARGFNPIPIESRAPVLTPPVRTWRTITEPDPRIEALVAAVSWPSLLARIQHLESFGTRYAITPQSAAAGESLHAFFQRQNLPVEYHYFQHAGLSMRNVVATQIGTSYPDSIIVVCAHYDSISEKPTTEAPGADDNASGTAAVQTVAQLLAPLSFEYTIKYVLFTAEELGLVGSARYAADARQNGLVIVGALNFDMLGFWSPKYGGDFDLEIESNQASQWLMNAITNAADLYTTMPYQSHVNDAAWWGDHASFWAEGYAAVNHEEAYDWDDPDFNPEYHTSQDKSRLINEDFMVGNTQIAVAAVATLARLLPSTPGNKTSFGRFRTRFKGN
ncbi:hypothetical protein DRQ53_05095 [bacterium]|nr:MAG: hypothetical protein DRQ53_05095 [bacterium]